MWTAADVSVAESEVMTLLGYNGMGHSTTIKCLFGLQRGTVVSIALSGESVEKKASFAIAPNGLILVPEDRPSTCSPATRSPAACRA